MLRIASMILAFIGLMLLSFTASAYAQDCAPEERSARGYCDPEDHERDRQATFDYDPGYGEDPCTMIAPEDFEREVDTKQAEYNWWEDCDWWEEDSNASAYPPPEDPKSQEDIKVNRVEVVETEEGHILPEEEQLPVTGVNVYIALAGAILLSTGVYTLRRTRA